MRGTSEYSRYLRYGDEKRRGRGSGDRKRRGRGVDYRNVWARVNVCTLCLLVHRSLAGYPHVRPVFLQKSPVLLQKSPVFSQKGLSSLILASTLSMRQARRYIFAYYQSHVSVCVYVCACTWKRVCVCVWVCECAAHETRRTSTLLEISSAHWIHR